MNPLSSAVDIVQRTDVDFALKYLTEDDLPFQMSLRNHLREMFGDTTEITQEKHLAWYTRIKSNQNIQYYVVWLEEERIGSLGVCHSEEGNELMSIMIRPEYQGKGIMSKVYLRLMEGSRERWWAYIKRWNVGAIRAMEKVGFRICRTDAEHVWLEVKCQNASEQPKRDGTF